MVLDTVRADAIEGAAPAMPFLASLARRGARFTNVASAAPWTHPSLATLLTGQLPPQHGVGPESVELHMSGAIASFPEALANGHGVQTVALFGTNWQAGPESAFQGFLGSQPNFSLIHSKEALPRVAERLDRSRPFCLLIHTFDAHDPYGEANRRSYQRASDEPGSEPKPMSLETLSELEAARIYLTEGAARLHLSRQGNEFCSRAHRYFARGFAMHPDFAFAAEMESAYRRGLSWMDGLLEPTLATLEQHGLLADTLLVVTADHGEGFGEHGIMSHGRSLHDEHVRVPLVIVGPGPFGVDRVVGTSFGLVDLFPTLFDAWGLEPLDRIAGRSVLADIAVDGPGRAVLSWDHLTTDLMGGHPSDVRISSARTRTHKYILRYDALAGTVRESFYDLLNDPAEFADLAVDGWVDQAVEPAIGAAIEQARSQIWGAVERTSAHIQMGYGANLGQVLTYRPQAIEILR